MNRNKRTEEKKNIRQDNQNNPELDNRKPQKPKFNMFWIYGLIALILIGMNFLNFGKYTDKITWSEFENELLKEGDVRKIVVVNEKTAEIYLKPESLTKEKYKDKFKKRYSRLQGESPHFKMDLPPVELYVETFNKIKTPDEEGNFVQITYETRENYLRDIFGLLWPILLIILIWIFIFPGLCPGL